MTANDFATAGFIDTWMRAVVARLDQLAPSAAATPPAEVVLYSVQKLAQVLDVYPSTVRAWLKKGKRGKAGAVVKLQAYQFTSEPRIPWPALLAYERGEDFDLASLPAPLLLPPAELAPAPLPTLSPPGPGPHLRVA
ncbi:MAG: hypothetical protein ACRYF0_04230 [Janthinobacterium lividum]